MSYLDRIFEVKREEVSRAIQLIPLNELRGRAEDTEPPRSFRKALQDSDKPLSLIAEIKKASPSKGVIRPNLDAIEVAEAYAEVGVHALSVLTDEKFFQGSADNLRKARRATNLPILRKDFIYHEYQVFEARAWGADAILLIVASLERGQIEDLHAQAKDLGMDVLVEVHSEREAEIALDGGAELIGINNRDLTDFSTSIDITERIAPLIVKEATVVSESALSTPEDLRRVREAGARAVLIGTAFCAAEDIKAKVKEVMGW